MIFLKKRVWILLFFSQSCNHSEYDERASARFTRFSIQTARLIV